MRKIFFALCVFAAVFISLFGYFFGKRGAVLGSENEGKLALLSVQKGGRIMPLSSAANDALRAVYGKSSFKLNGGHASAAEIIAIANASPQKAAELEIFKTDNRELARLSGSKTRYFSYRDFEKIFGQAYEAAVSGDGSEYASACAQAISNIALFEDFSVSLGFSFNGLSPSKTFERWLELSARAKREIEASRAENRGPDMEILRPMSEMLRNLSESRERFESRKSSNIHAVKNGEGYASPLSMLYLRNEATPEGDAYLKDFSLFLEKFAAGDTGGAGKTLDSLLKRNPPSFRVRFENFYNKLDVFYRAALLYAAAFAAFAAGAVFKKRGAEFFAAGLLFFGFAAFLQAAGIAARVFIQMRPPITNLYSSIIFAGSAAALAGFFICAFKRSAAWAFAGCLAGALSVVAALNMPYSGDTMGMMRAVLNSNFWLTVHIVPIMLGYCGVFLAGFYASAKLVSNILPPQNTALKNSEAAKSVYKITAAAMALSFAGTMLGGVWAQMSWGRFWGWDPKENGALMVVLWCALIVHARASKIAGNRALLALAAFGNIVAAWAWFGVNIMGVGLHSYGFMDGGAKYLAAFIAAQFAVLPLALLPEKK